MKIKILLNESEDITQYFVELPEIKESVEESLDINNEVEFLVINTQNWCDIRNKTSIFYGNALTDFIISVYFNDVLVIKGKVVEVSPTDNNKAKIKIKNISTELETQITQSYSYKTIQQLITELEADYKIDFHKPSWLNLYENVQGYTYTIRIAEQDDYKFSELFNDMAQSLNLFIYQSHGQIYAKNPYRSNTNYTAIINYNDILSYNSSITYEKLINNYSIKYYLNSETPLTDDTNGNIGSVSRQIFGEKAMKEIDASQQSNFIIMTKEGASYSGMNYIRRYNKPLTVLELTFPVEYYFSLDVASNYLILDDIYQLISKSLSISGNICTCIFWSY